MSEEINQNTPTSEDKPEENKENLQETSGNEEKSKQEVDKEKVDEEKKLARQRKTIKITLLLVVIFLPPIIIFLWQDAEKRAVIDEFNAQKDSLRLAVTEKMESVLEDKTMQLTLGYSLALQSEVSRGKLDKASEYMIQAVKEEGIVSISIVDNLGNVALSTNKKQEGARFSKTAFGIPEDEGVNLLIKKAETRKITESKYLGAAPIFREGEIVARMILILEEDIYWISEIIKKEDPVN